ncbi:hypothetical protein [Saccharothrix lopnurensis]|uniref:hypothetical protein n=1 Tax=Saccharothrix lopnurensis TaxID=1670621 RepID=UPI0036D39A1C
MDGTPVGEERLVLDPAASPRIEVTVHNGTDVVRHVKSVRLSGAVLALTFFSYDTTVPFEVPGRQSVTRAFALDVSQLGGQATGLLPTTLEVLDANRDVIGSARAVGDVRGSMWSVYGLFGLAMAVLTVLAWTGVLLALARRRLPAGRWGRAARFLPAGVGSGLVAVIALSVLRVVVPSPGVGVGLVLGTAGVVFALGCLTRHPDADDLPPEPAGGSPDLPPADPEATQRIPRPLPGRVA